MDPRLSPLRSATRQAASVGAVGVSLVRLVGRVSPFVWLAVALALAMPFYLRYFAWALGACGLVTFAPMR